MLKGLSDGSGSRRTCQDTHTHTHIHTHTKPDLMPSQQSTRTSAKFMQVFQIAGNVNLTIRRVHKVKMLPVHRTTLRKI